MTTSKGFITALISGLLLAPVQIGNSCAWYYDEDEIVVSPLDQTLVNLQDLDPFFYSYHYYKGYSWESDDNDHNVIYDEQESNLDDWYAHFKKEYERDELRMLIYKTDKYGFENLKNYIRDKKNPPPTLSFYPLVNDWKNGKYNEEFQYLYFAKKVEPFVQGHDYWEDPEPVDSAAMRQLEQTALQQIDLTTDHFVQQRYIYQAMRLAHHLHEYTLCLKIYDKYQNILNDRSMTALWCLSLRAGAYWHLDQFAEASYYHSIVFDLCPTRRLYAERDFYIDNDDTWHRCLAMCTTDHEKEVLWALAGIKQNNAALPALQAVMEINPASHLLELLLAREIEKVQRNYFPARDQEELGAADDTGWYIPDTNNDIDTLAAIIDHGLGTGKVRTPAFWNASRSLIAYTQQDYMAAEHFAENARLTAGNDLALTEQANILKALAMVQSLPVINSANEQIVMEALHSFLPEQKADQFRYTSYNTVNDTYRLIMYHLYTLYAADDNYAKAEICKSEFRDYYDMYQNFTKDAVDHLLQYEDAPDQTALDGFLKEVYFYSKDNLLEMRGTLEMREDHFAEAIKWYKQISDSSQITNFSLPTDPFLIHAIDCHDCDNALHPDNYTKLSLAEEMVDLEDQLKHNTGDKALICHRLGNAYYNMTHFGNAWEAKDYYLCAGCDGEYPGLGSGYEDYDCSEAAKYYQLAVNYSKDKEFKAMNVFMLAKCEQNAYYMSEDFEYENTNGLKANHQTNFAVLKDKYAKTDFYREAIGECKYFEYYVSHH